MGKGVLPHVGRFSMEVEGMGRLYQVRVEEQKVRAFNERFLGASSMTIQ